MENIRSFRELRVWLKAMDLAELARRCDYLEPASAAKLDNDYEDGLGMPVNMAAHPEHWTIR